MSSAITIQAYAKVNLSLEVVGKRPDGFHNLVSIMQTIALADNLHVTPARGLHLRAPGMDLPQSENLVIRAAELLRMHSGRADGAALKLSKFTPEAAGLGGGSSDAAAALVALNRLWRIGAGCDCLRATAEQLGSDVPFFLVGGTALVEGKGERVSLLPQPMPSWYVLAKPLIGVATARVFHALSPTEWTDGTKTRQLAESVSPRARVKMGVNGLQNTLFRLCPESYACYQSLWVLAEGRAIISGSGPTTLGIFDSLEEATQAARTIQEGGYWAVVTQPCTPPEWQTPCV